MYILEKIEKYLKEDDKAAYKKFFEAKLKEFGVKSPDELSKEEKKKFFNQIDKEWKAKGEKGDK